MMVSELRSQDGRTCAHGSGSTVLCCFLPGFLVFSARALFLCGFLCGFSVASGWFLFWFLCEFFCGFSGFSMSSVFYCGFSVVLLCFRWLCCGSRVLSTVVSLCFFRGFCLLCGPTDSLWFCRREARGAVWECTEGI